MDIKTVPPLSEFFHSIDVQIRFNDVDILGHLNNTVYFSFFDTGKAYFFENALNRKMEWRKVECVIANIDCAYHSPIYFGEQIEVLTRCCHVGEKSFVLQQVIVEKSTREVKAAANTVMVSINPDTKEAVVVPHHYRKGLEESMQMQKTKQEADTL